MQPDEAAGIAKGIREELAKVIIGQPDLLEQATAAVLAGGHVLLEGAPGTAKTLLVRALAMAVEGRFARIQFTPDLMPADITGVNMYHPHSGEFMFREGPVFCDLLLADEINRAPAKTQSALLEAMQDKQVSVDGQLRPLADAFTTFATQNPVEHEGTYPLPEAQLDRFMFKLLIDYPSEDGEVQMLQRHQDGFDPRRLATSDIRGIATPGQLFEVRQAVRSLHASPALLRYAASIVRATRTHPSLVLGASPRGSVMLLAAARAAAVLRGRGYVTPDDVRDMAPPVLRHRLMLSPESEIEGMSPDHCVRRILDSIEVPRLS